MLTPNDGRHVVLLPQDKEIMTLTGMDEGQYRWFCRQAILHSKLRPGEPTAFFDPVSFLITLVIGIALSYVATLLAPKPKQPSQGPEQRNVQGQTLVNGSRFTPRSGFDSAQNVVELGSTVPLVYTNRQVIDGVGYGGIRVNTNLLWSQIYSIGGGQLLRSVFLVSEASVPALDPTQFAIGNNLISNYDLERREAGRITLYYSSDGGRLTSADYIAGQDPANDVGNAESAGGGDVFQVRGPGDAWTTDFCYTSTPNNQTSFGVYGLIGNNLPYRTNPVFRPAVLAETDKDGDLNCKGDPQQIVARNKQNVTFAGRSGLVGTPGLQILSIGDTVELQLFSTSDAEREFTNNDAFETCGDVAQTVSSRQRSYDEQLSYGDLYRIGSALGICTYRTPNAFVSEADNEPVGGGVDVTARFEIVREGEAHFWSADELQADGGVTATESSHVLQAAEAMFAIERQGQVVEVGIRSGIQLNINGLSNFRDGRTYSRIDYDACDKYDGDKAEDAELLNFTSGQYSSSETRYSFFRVGYRIAGSTGDFVNMEPLFGVRSTTGVAVYNYLRFEFSESRRWEIRITPISGWEVRNNVAIGSLEVLDPHLQNIRTVVSGDVTIRYTGEEVQRTVDTFSVRSLTTNIYAIASLDLTSLVGGKGYAAGTYNNVQLTGGDFGKQAEATIVVTVPEVSPGVPDPLGGSVTSVTLTSGGAYYKAGQTIGADPGEIPAHPGAIITQEFSIKVGSVRRISLGNGFDDGEYYGDSYAKLAEDFMYNEITTTASQPENEIVYINTISENVGTPNYDKLAIVGMNIRSSKEIRSLSQFSVYVNKGINSTSSFPEVLYDLLTNDRYGTGQVMSPAQIDKQSFDDAAAWVYSRRYFFDGAISEKINLRSWGSEVSSNFLLDLLMRNGKFALQPVVNFGAPETITGLFSSGNILQDSFELSYVDEQDRIPPRISVIWREERETSTTDGKGLFPVMREVTVREVNTPEDAPLEKIDLGDYCTSQRHAIDVAKWQCRTRRLTTHSVAFKTTPSEAALDLGAVFKLGMETLTYDQPANGAISDTGAVTSWPPLPDGSYPALLWNGKTDRLQEIDLRISGGSAGGYENSVFCLRNTASDTQTYKTMMLSFDEDGNLDVEAIYFPTNSEGVSEAGFGFDDPINWVIEGEIN